VYVPHFHLLSEYRLQLDVSLPPEDDPKFLACCVLSVNLPQFDFGEFPHHPLETNTPTILNDPAIRNPLDLSQVNVEARQLVHLYWPPTGKLAIRVPAGNQTEIRGRAIRLEVHFSANDQWHVGQESSYVVFRESFVILPCTLAWKYLGSE
jgi:hypothetical protein